MSRESPLSQVRSSVSRRPALSIPSARTHGCASPAPRCAGTRLYMSGERGCGLPGVYADGFDVQLPYWLEKWRPASCPSGIFASMLYRATGNRRLLTLRVTGFTQAGRPVYAAPEALFGGESG